MPHQEEQEERAAEQRHGHPRLEVRVSEEGALNQLSSSQEYGAGQETQGQDGPMGSRRDAPHDVGDDQSNEGYQARNRDRDGGAR